VAGAFAGDRAQHTARRDVKMGCKCKVDAKLDDKGNLHRWKLAKCPLHEAAEDMLAALEEFESLVSDSFGVDGHHENGDSAAWSEFEFVQAARDAIMKARGEV